MDQQFLEYLLAYAWSGVQSQGYNPADFSAEQIIAVLSVEIVELRVPLSPFAQEFTRCWEQMRTAARA